MEPDDDAWLSDALEVLASRIEARDGPGNHWGEGPQSMMLGIGVEVHARSIYQTDLIRQELGRILRRNGRLDERRIEWCEQLLNGAITVVPAYIDFGQVGHSRVLHGIERRKSG